MTKAASFGAAATQGSRAFGRKSAKNGEQAFGPAPRRVSSGTGGEGTIVSSTKSSSLSKGGK